MDFQSDIDSLLLSLVSNRECGLKPIEMLSLKTILRKRIQTPLLSYFYEKLTEYLEVYHSLTRYLCILILNDCLKSFPEFRDLFLLNYDLKRLFDLTILGSSENPSDRITSLKKNDQKKKKKKLSSSQKPRKSSKIFPRLLPPPIEYTETLRNKSLECFESWFEKFGLEHQELRIGYQYLKDKFKVKFPSEIKSIQKSTMKLKLDRVQREMKEYKDSITGVILQISNCMKMIIPEIVPLELQRNSQNNINTSKIKETIETIETKEEEKTKTENIEEEEEEEEEEWVSGEEENDGFGMEEVIQDLGLVNRNYFLEVEINKKEMKKFKKKCDPLIEEKIVEFCKELGKRYYPMVVEWNSVLLEIKEIDINYSRIKDFENCEMEIENLKKRIEIIFDQIQEIGIKLPKFSDRNIFNFNFNFRKRRRDEDDEEQLRNIKKKRKL